MNAATPASDAAQKAPPQINEAELLAINQRMIESDLITSDWIYADLALFKDYNIGTLLSFYDERKAQLPPEAARALYQSILDVLPDYQQRKFDDLAHYFPKFGLTNAEIQARRRDPKWAGRILHNSPITPFVRTMKAQILTNVNHSRVIGKLDEITVVINTYPLQLSDQNRAVIGIYFADLLKVRVTVKYLDPNTFTLADVIKYDEIYTYYFRELFSHEDILAGYTALKFVSKRLFVPRIFGDTIVVRMDTQREEMIVKTRCDILTQFQYMPSLLCSSVSPDN